jgi:hypothetical protein
MVNLVVLKVAHIGTQPRTYKPYSLDCQSKLITLKIQSQSDATMFYFHPTKNKTLPKITIATIKHTRVQHNEERDSL